MAWPHSGLTGLIRGRMFIAERRPRLPVALFPSGELGRIQSESPVRSTGGALLHEKLLSRFCLCSRQVTLEAEIARRRLPFRQSASRSQT